MLIATGKKINCTTGFFGPNAGLVLLRHICPNATPTCNFGAPGREASSRGGALIRAHRGVEPPYNAGPARLTHRTKRVTGD